MGLKDKILAAPDRTRKGPLVVPEWSVVADDGLFLRTLSVAERGEFEAWAKRNEESTVAISLRFLSLVLVHEDGKPVFGDQDLTFLREKNSAVVMRLIDEAQRLNSLSAEDVEELRKNFSKTPGPISPSS